MNRGKSCENFLVKRNKSTNKHNSVGTFRIEHQITTSLLSDLKITFLLLQAYAPLILFFLLQNPNKPSAHIEAANKYYVSCKAGESIAFLTIFYTFSPKTIFLVTVT